MTLNFELLYSPYILTDKLNADEVFSSFLQFKNPLIESDFTCNELSTSFTTLQINGTIQSDKNLPKKHIFDNVLVDHLHVKGNVLFEGKRVFQNLELDDMEVNGETITIKTADFDVLDIFLLSVKNMIVEGVVSSSSALSCRNLVFLPNSLLAAPFLNSKRLNANTMVTDVLQSSSATLNTLFSNYPILQSGRLGVTLSRTFITDLECTNLRPSFFINVTGDGLTCNNLKYTGSKNPELPAQLNLSSCIASIFSTTSASIPSISSSVTIPSLSTVGMEVKTSSTFKNSLSIQSNFVCGQIKQGSIRKNNLLRETIFTGNVKFNRVFAINKVGGQTTYEKAIKFSDNTQQLTAFKQTESYIMRIQVRNVGPVDFSDGAARVYTDISSAILQRGKTYKITYQLVYYYEGGSTAPTIAVYPYFKTYDFHNNFFGVWVAERIIEYNNSEPLSISISWGTGTIMRVLKGSFMIVQELRS